MENQTENNVRQSEEKYYCRKDRHPHPDSMRMGDKLWRPVIDCPHICCLSCPRRYSCDLACWFAQTHKGETKCPDQCTVQEKVFGKLLYEKETEPAHSC